MPRHDTPCSVLGRWAASVRAFFGSTKLDGNGRIAASTRRHPMTTTDLMRYLHLNFQFRKHSFVSILPGPMSHPIHQQSRHHLGEAPALKGKSFRRKQGTNGRWPPRLVGQDASSAGSSRILQPCRHQTSQGSVASRWGLARQHSPVFLSQQGWQRATE